MASIISDRPARLLCLLVLAALAFCHVRMALLLQSEYSDRKVTNPEEAYRLNPRMLTWHARQRHLLDADPQAAELLYRQALAVNPLFIPAWLGLAELKNDTGDRRAADAVLDLVDRYTHEVKRYRWDKALVAYQMQRRDVLERDLAYLVAEVGGKTRDDALRMAFSLWPEPAELMRVMGSNNLAALFRYAVHTRKIDEAAALWTGMGEGAAALPQKEVAAFVNVLLNDNRMDLATAIWKQVFNPEALLHDGNFAAKPLQTAFGWRIGTIKGSTWRIEEPGREQPERSLHLRFNHLENIDFQHISQVVPLEGGREYRLKGQWKSEALTTDQRPFVEVAGYKCQAPVVRTEMIAPSQPWQEFVLAFTVPDGCRAMVARVRRPPSRQIDNQLGGELWLTRLAILSTVISIMPLVEGSR